MKEFIAKFENGIAGTLSGYDRLVVGGNLPLRHERGLKGYLWANQLGLKDFGAHAEAVSKQIKEASLAAIRQADRPVVYLRSANEDKQQMARLIAQRDGVTCGPICALTAVEMSRSYEIRGDRVSKKLVLQTRQRPGLVIYRYDIHPIFGLLGVRLQTWFPFQMLVYLNGREWLARQMDQTGMRYRKHKNCFTWVEDFSRAQALLDEQMTVNWGELMTSIQQQVNPLFPQLCRNFPMSYYWSCGESEWATDIIFRDAEHLRRLYPQLLHLGMTCFSSTDVLRFFGKRATRGGAQPGRYDLDINTDLRVRTSGVRLKHRLGPNSLKMYDKAYDERGAVLRLELTLNRCEIFRVYRTKINDPEGEKSWRTMRRGLVDLGRRAQACQKALDMYSSALAAVDDSTTLEELVAGLESRIKHNGRSYRALHPFERDDLALCRAIHRGEFAIHGFRNRDLQAQLYMGQPKTPSEKRSRSAAISRKLKLLRVHGLIRKLPHTHRYRVTPNGAKILNAILSAQRFTVQQILNAA
jgi:hypothetical protein